MLMILLSDGHMNKPGSLWCHKAPKSNTEKKRHYSDTLNLKV